MAAWMGVLGLALTGLAVSAKADLISAEANDNRATVGNFEPSAQTAEQADSGPSDKTCACRLWGVGSDRGASLDFSLFANAQLGSGKKSLPSAAADRLSGDTKVVSPISTDYAGSKDQADTSNGQAGLDAYGNGTAYIEAVGYGIPASGLVVAKSGVGGEGTYDPSTGVASSSDPFEGSGKTFRPDPIDPILRSGSPVPVTKASITDVSEPGLLIMLATGCTVLGLLILTRLS